MELYGQKSYRIFFKNYHAARKNVEKYNMTIVKTYKEKYSKKPPHFEVTDDAILKKKCNSEELINFLFNRDSLNYFISNSAAYLSLQTNTVFI